MTTETTTTTDERQNGNQPGYVAKVRQGFGKKATYERIDVAWLNEDGAIYVKFSGTQVVSSGFTLYKLEDNDKAGA
jgi:hypothetical protein